jgi:uncharacterized membrane protein YiaA
MKTKYLLPHRFQIVGWFLFLTGLFFFIWGAYRGEDEIPFGWQISVPWPFEDSNSLFSNTVRDGRIYLDIADELVDLAIIIGLLMAAFSCQKIEDERIAQIRLEALQWGFYANYVMLILSIILIYGSAFLLVLAYNMFTPLIIFVLRFYWLLLIRPVIEAKRERRLS